MKKIILVFIALFAFASCKDEKVTPAKPFYVQVNPIGNTYEDGAGNVYLFNTDNVVVNSIAYPLTRNGGGNLVSPVINSPSFYIGLMGSGATAIFESDGDITRIVQI